MSATGSWTPLITGLICQNVKAIAINNDYDYVYVGGNFVEAENIPANNIAIWVPTPPIIGTVSYEFT